MSTNRTTDTSKLTATVTELVDLFDTLELDIEEMRQLDALEVSLSAAANGEYPWTTLAALVWLKVRREGHPGLSWADAEARIRVPLHA